MDTTFEGVEKNSCVIFDIAQAVYLRQKACNQSFWARYLIVLQFQALFVTDINRRINNCNKLCTMEQVEWPVRQLANCRQCLHPALISVVRDS
jgi:hypothetical protein